MKETRVISRNLARRMAIVAQGLAGSRPRADTEGIMDVIGRLGCLQLDPITIVARSPVRSDERSSAKLRELQALPKDRQMAVQVKYQKEWDAAKEQIHQPGKKHRLERLAVAQLPYHPQYMDPGTSFNADLRRGLDFGAEPLTPGLLEHIGTPLPSGSVVHAALVTPLGSAKSKKGDPVEAIDHAAARRLQ